VTDRRAVGDERFARVLASLRGAPSLSVLLREKEDSDSETIARASQARAALGAPLGPDALADLPRADEHGRDVLAIGGVSEANLGDLAPWRDRITGVAGIRLFQESDDPASVVRGIAAQ
jgi:thiamine monophosphate synthase